MDKVDPHDNYMDANMREQDRLQMSSIHAYQNSKDISGGSIFVDQLGASDNQIKTVTH